MNELQVFEHPEFGKIRAIEIDGEPWFVGRDVAQALGYSDTKSAIADHVDPEDRQVIKRGQNATFEIPNRGLTLINESGMYSLVLSSKKPEAKEVKRWVTHDVLPTIRKTGSYSANLSPAELFMQQATVNLEFERQLNALADRTTQTEERVTQAEARVTNAAAVFAVPAYTKDDWQAKMNTAINETVLAYGLNHQTFWGELYQKLESRAGVNLTARQSRLRARLRQAGATARETEAVTKLHVIAQDTKLREIFTALVQSERAKLICTGRKEA